MVVLTLFSLKERPDFGHFGGVAHKPLENRNLGRLVLTGHLPIALSLNLAEVYVQSRRLE